MRIKDGFVLRKICGKNVISGEGTDKVNFSTLLTVNDTACFLWGLLEQKEISQEELADALVQEYGIDHQLASKDVAAFITKLDELGIIEK